MTALGLGLVAALCWGLHDIAIRYLSRSVPLLSALFVVLCVGALFQLSAILILGGGFFVSGPGVLLSLGAGIAFLVASLGLYYAFERGPVRLVAPVIASFPIISVGYAIANGRTISPGQGLAVLAIVIGVGLVAALSDHSDDDIPPIGRTILLSVISAFGFATTFKLGQLAADLSGELPTTLIARLTALSLLTAIILTRRATFLPGRKAVAPLIGMGLLDGVALLCVLSAGKMPNPEYASVTSSMFGLLTILLAWAFLRERMAPPQWTGCLIAFAGVGYLAL